MSTTETATNYAQRGVDTAKDVTSRATKASQDYLDQLYQYIQQTSDQLSGTTKYYWDGFPPLRWLAYTMAAFNAVPIAVFLAWAIFTFGIVATIAGIGIFVVEGFFGFWGLAAFLIVAGFLTFIALVLVGFATFAWGGVKATDAALSKTSYGRKIKKSYKEGDI